MRTLYISGLIDASVADSIRQQLTGLPPTEAVHVSINSDGGAVSAAAEIYALLTAWRGQVTTQVSGWALSAASMILMAGKRRLAHGTSLLMVHAPWLSGASGNAAALRESAAALDRVAESMRAAYRRSGQADAVITGWLSGGDHWFTADVALAAGLITEVIDVTVPAEARHAFASCRHPVPPEILERIATMTTPSAAAPNTDATIQAARVAEFDRQRGIRDNFKPFATRDDMEALQAACLDDMSCTAADAGHRILAQLARDVTPAAGWYRADMNVAPAADRSRAAEFHAAAVDALCLRSGVSVAKPHPAARDLTRMSIVTMAENILSMHGKPTQGLSAAGMISAALSTSDFPELLSNAAGKSLLTGYTQAPNSHTMWTSSRTVKDFKPQTLLLLGEAPGLDVVVEAAEYTFGSMPESAETFSIAKYGKMLRITREALINDDLSAFTAIPASMGAAARRKEADLVYGKLNSNPTMSDSVALFHADHGNLAAVAAAPSVTSLGAARAAMRKQKGIAGLDFIDPQPRFLIVPVALETLCEQLLASLADPAKSNDTTNPAWIRGLTLVADPRLDATSATAWYLAASPQQIEGIARAYLQGETEPHIEDNEGFYNDTMDWKVRHEFAAAVCGWRALYKNAGA
jgi:ATP-dependent protease ClpP protease subunit/phage major head subunit gpT-like protein